MRQLLPVVAVDVVWGTSLTWTHCQAVGKPRFCAKQVDSSLLVVGAHPPREFSSLGLVSDAVVSEAGRQVGSECGHGEAG